MAKKRRAAVRPKLEVIDRTPRELDVWPGSVDSFNRSIAEIRMYIKTELRPFIEGPFNKKTGVDCYAMNLGDGPKFYRRKKGLKEKYINRIYFLERAERDAAAAVSFYGPKTSPTGLFSAALRIGMNLQAAEANLTKSQAIRGLDKAIKIKKAKAKDRRDRFLPDAMKRMDFEVDINKLKPTPASRKVATQLAHDKDAPKYRWILDRYNERQKADCAPC